MCSGLGNGSYEEKLSQLGIDKLELRRIKIDLIQTWKIIHGYDKIDESILFERAHQGANRVTRATASEFNLKMNICRIDQRRKFFSERVVSIWNNLPENIKATEKLGPFRRRLDEYYNNNQI